LARMIQWLVLSMLTSTDYLRKKDGNDSREMQDVKRRCFTWSTSRCLLRDTGDELVWLPICVCLTKDVRKIIAHLFIEIWIGWCRSTSCRGVMQGCCDRRWSSVTRFAWWWQDLHAIELLRALIGECIITRMLDYWRVMCFTDYWLNWNSWIWIPCPIDSECTLLCAQVDRTRYSSIASGNNCIVQLCKCVSLHL
jgi:hypothetical protein